MDNFFIEYRDPMFSVIILFFIIFIIAFVNYWWSVFKSKEEKNSIERFIKRFEVQKERDAYKEILDSFKLSTESLALLAQTYTKSGDFETAIGIYLIALKQVRGRDKKRYILFELGKAYFKAGFLQRSSEVLLESLRLSPRDAESLKYLFVCHEILKSYDLAFQALSSLEELEVDVTKEKAYLHAKEVLDDLELSAKEKLEKLKKYEKDFPLVKRMEVELKQSHGIFKSEDLEDVDAKMVLDLVWYMDEDEVDLSHLKEPLYQSVAAVKGAPDAKESSKIFEFEVLDSLRKARYDKATLNFEYTCKECKQTFPIFFYRCPNCHSLSTANIQPTLISKDHEIYLPFQ